MFEPVEDKAWQITEDNIDVLQNITNFPKKHLESSIGWVVVVRGFRAEMMPFHTFKGMFPKLELTEMKITKKPPLYSKAAMEQLLEKAKLLGFTDDVTHWTKELAKVT